MVNCAIMGPLLCGIPKFASFGVTFDSVNSVFEHNEGRREWGLKKVNSSSWWSFFDYVDLITLRLASSSYLHQRWGVETTFGLVIPDIMNRAAFCTGKGTAPLDAAKKSLPQHIEDLIKARGMKQVDFDALHDTVPKRRRSPRIKQDEQGVVTGVGSYFRWMERDEFSKEVYASQLDLRNRAMKTKKEHPLVCVAVPDLLNVADLLAAM